MKLITEHLGEYPEVKKCSIKVILFLTPLSLIMIGDREIYDENIWNSFLSKYTAQYLDKYIIIPSYYHCLLNSMFFNVSEEQFF